MIGEVHIIGPPDPSADMYARLVAILKAQGTLLRIECEPDSVIRDSIVTYGAARIADGRVVWWLLHHWPDTNVWLLTVNTSLGAEVLEDLNQVGVRAVRLLNAFPPTPTELPPDTPLES